MAVTWKKLAYDAEVVKKTDFAAYSILVADTVDIPAAVELAVSELIGRKATGGIVALAKADVLTILNVADGADVTGDQAPKAHKDSHDPAEAGEDPLDCAAAGEIVGIADAAEGSSHSFARADHTHQIQHSIADNHIVTMDDSGPAVDDEIAVFTASGLEGQTCATVAGTLALDDIGVPDAGVDFDLQQAVDLVVFTVANESTRDGLSAGATAVGQLCWATTEGTLAICSASS